MAKFITISALSLFLIFSVYHIIVLRNEREEARAAYKIAEEKLIDLKEEGASLEKELDYYANPLNIEKELRARFNYKLPGERTIILVPSSTSSSAASSSQ